MAAYTSVRRIVVVPIVTLCTACACVRPTQNPIIVVNREGSRRPARCSRVAHRTIRRDIKHNVVRVRGLVEIRGVASRALCRRTCISPSVALYTICGKVRSGQREARCVVVKSIVRIAGWVTSQASRAAVSVATYAIVIIVCLWVGVASSAAEFCIICRIGMAVGTGTPFTLVFSTVNREKLGVVVKSRGRPGGFAVATGTIGGELRGRMVWIGGRVVIRSVTARAGIRRSIVVAVVTGGAIVRNNRMRPV